MSQHIPASPVRWTALLVALLCAVSGCALSGGDTGTSPSQSASTVPPSPQQYVALGDSYVSAPLVPVTDIANGCFRSSSNYPSLIARALDAELDDRSCGAAEVRDLFGSQRPGVPPQLDALSAEVDLVTLSMGGNDEGVFTQLVNRCPQLRALAPDGAPCRDAMRAEDGDVLLRALERTRSRLTTALERIHRRAPEAEVLVVGYPQIVDADNVCARLPMARGDYAYAEKVNQALTEALREAANATDSGYVDLWDEGHDICSEEPWVNGSVTDQRRAAAYHPFAEGQAAAAERVVAALQGDRASRQAG